MNRIIPAPPSDGLQPTLVTWPRGKRLYRVHAATRSATMFNPGMGRGRFHPLRDAGGKPVPTLYAADRIDGALSESVFRNVVGGEGIVLRAQLKSLVLSRLIQRTNLTLVDLTGYHLRRLGLTRAQLIESGASAYSETATWAEALHACCTDAQGLMWVSRQFDTAKAIVLFGDRVRDTIGDTDTGPESLYRGPGFRRVQAAARQANIAIVEG